jgi:hypothetical protein
LEICHYFSAASVLMMVADEMADAGNSNSNKTRQNDNFHLLPFTFYLLPFTVQVLIIQVLWHYQ